MKVRCAWCGDDMGEKFGPAELVTHGICGPCQERVAREIQQRTEVCPDHGRHFPVRSRLAPGSVCPECERELLDDSPTLAEVNARRGWE